MCKALRLRAEENINTDLNILIVLGKGNEAHGKIKYSVGRAVTETIMFYERKGI